MFACSCNLDQSSLKTILGNKWPYLELATIYCASQEKYQFIKKKSASIYLMTMPL